MTGLSCCLSVKYALEALPGVISATVSLTEREAQVIYSKDSTMPVQLLLDAWKFFPCTLLFFFELAIQTGSLLVFSSMAWL